MIRGELAEEKRAIKIVSVIDEKYIEDVRKQVETTERNEVGFRRCNDVNITVEVKKELKDWASIVADKIARQNFWF